MTMYGRWRQKGERVTLPGGENMITKIKGKAVKLNPHVALVTEGISVPTG